MDLPVWGQEPPRRRRTGVWIGVSVGLVALVGAGVAGWLLVGQKLLPARSPQAAVERLVDGLSRKDALAMYGAVSHAEVDPFRRIVQAASDESTATADPDATAAFRAAFDSLAVTVEGLELTTTELDTGLAKVELAGGVVTLDGDPAVIADAFTAALDARGAASLPGLSAADLRDGLDEALPYTLDLATLAGDEAGAPFVVTVHEGRGWYVSPLMTLGEYLVTADGGTRGAMPDPAQVARPADPQAAAAALAAAVPALADGDAGPLVAALPLAERRFVAVYVQPALDRSPPSTASAGVSLTAAQFAVAQQSADRATVTATDLSYVTGGGTLTIAAGCVTVPEAPDAPVCFGDVPILAELGLDDPPLTVVREDGAWYVSVLGTLADLSATAGENVQRLAAEGRLDDPEWLAQQVPELDEMLGDVYGAAPEGS